MCLQTKYLFYNHYRLSIFLCFCFSMLQGKLIGLPPRLLDKNSVNTQYSLLQRYLLNYESMLIEGGWVRLPMQKKVIKTGDKQVIIGLIRRRLAKENYLSPFTAKPDSFDYALSHVLQCYQRNNGCDVSGMIDAQTISAMNIPLEKRIEQIKVNMKRWSDFPVDTGEKYLLVNVADFKFSVIRKDCVLLAMKTIVGRYYRKTPRIHSMLTHIIFNPEWVVPENILTKDVLPEIKKNPLYIERRHMKVFRVAGGKRTEIDPSEIDWQNLKQDQFPYSIVQDPGPDNALGCVKFLFPNSFFVYMHDTPTKDLFKAREPIFSSGCIRLSNAIGLAMHILADEGWTAEKVISAVNGENNYTVAIKKKIPVYIEYFTSWVDAVGVLQFRKDIYDQDHIGQ